MPRAKEPQLAILASNTVLSGGLFRIESLLATGGFGEVYLAWQPRMQRQVAIKVLRPEISEDARVRTRFEREAMAAGGLLHPNILPVFVFDYDEPSGIWFLAMQYVPGGRTLADYLRAEGGRLEPNEATRILTGIASALDAAHRAGIVHRDVKPPNVLLDEQSRPILTDFGIAQLGDAPSLTETSVRIGTAVYMAPEQWRGQQAQAGTDQYALGVVAYELLAGQPPFQGDPMSLMYQHLESAPPEPAAFNPTLGPTVSGVLRRAMSKQPAERFPSCTAFATALSEALSAPRPANPPERVPPVLPTEPMTPPAPPKPPGADADRSAPSGWRDAKLTVGAILGLLLVVGVVLVARGALNNEPAASGGASGGGASGSKAALAPTATEALSILGGPGLAITIPSPTARPLVAPLPTPTEDDFFGRVIETAIAAVAAETGPTATPPRLTRASSLERQAVNLCKYGSRFTAEVSSAMDRPDNLIALIVRASNSGPSEQNIFIAADLRDDQGRVVEMADTAVPEVYAATLEELRRDRRALQDSGDSISPGASADVLLLYRAFGDARSFDLVPNNWSC